MAQYAFKIFNAERMNGSGNTPVPFVDATWGDFPARLVRFYERQRGHKHHENPQDAYDTEGAKIPLDPNSRILRLDWVQRHEMSVFFGLSLGKNDGFFDAMNATDGAPDESIEHLAPRRQYRGVYVLPPGETEGVLALEVVNRSCPAEFLRRWTNKWSEEQTPIDAAEKLVTKHTRLRFHQVTDSGQVKSLLNEGEPQEIVLIEHIPRGNGLPDLVQYKLVAPVRHKKHAMQTVKGWVQGNDGDKVSKIDGIAQARALVGPEVEGVEFDDCYVSVKLEGQTQHVRPDAYSELFTYDTRAKQRETDAFFKQVNAKLASLGLATTMSLDLTGWPTNLPTLRPAVPD